MATAKQTTRISKILRKVRIDAEVTRIQMAKDVGVGEKELIAIEAGKLSPDFALLERIGLHYGENDFFRLTEELKDAAAEVASTIILDMSSFTKAERMTVLELKYNAELRITQDQMLEDQVKADEKEAKARARAEKKNKPLVEAITEALGDHQHCAA